MSDSKLALYFKGMAMGTVDIVPGVSGSTVAVLLGIYERFITSLKNINLKLIGAILSPLWHRFDKESRIHATEAAKHADLPWLLILLSGLASAFVVASMVIPLLMERYPEMMRGLFFGLVLGSIATPIRSIQSWKFSRFFVILLFSTAIFFILGQQLSMPSYLVEVTAQGGQTLEEACRMQPCFHASPDILALPENASLREAIASPSSVIPDGTVFYVSKPYLPFCFCAGFAAICAMLMPGISGSFMLLVLGCYYFMLNTGKGFVGGLLHGEFYATSLLYIICLAAGAIFGIALFSRIIAWLLKHYRDLTHAAIIGILLGCLRAIWPFRVLDHGVSSNALPAIDMPMFWQTCECMLAGLSVVALTVYIQIRQEKHRHNKRNCVIP